MEDYRESHVAKDKGAAYARSFTKNNNKRFIWEWEQSLLAEIVANCSLDSESRYLDFACGTGRITVFMEKFFNNAYGVDVSESMINEARASAKKADLRLVDLTIERPFDDAFFDVISAFRFFVNAQDELRQEVMKSLSRLLKPNGVLIFNVHINRNSAFARSVLLRKLFQRKKDDSFRTMSVAEAQELIDRNGLKIRRVYHRGIVPIFNDDSEMPPFDVLKKIEDFSSRVRALAPVSRYLVYVCEPR